MSSTGYPDFQDARDYMAGLIGEQQVDGLQSFAAALPFGPTQIGPNVAAGAHVVIRSVQVQLYVSATAGGTASPFLSVTAANGLAGTQPGTAVAFMLPFIETKASTDRMDSYVFPGPLVISGGAGGNHLSVSGLGATNVATFGYSVLIYRVQLT